MTGGGGAKFVLAGFGYNDGWRVADHPRFLADLNGDRKADIIGFGDAGVWVALSNGDGTFQPASFVLADFGAQAGPIVATITVDFHTYDDDLNDDSLLHVFVKNRSSDSSDSEGPTTYIGNHQAYLDHDADWYGKNPYLGCAINASHGQALGDNSTTRVNIDLRSKPIPLEELVLPVVNCHILAKHTDTWKFDYTLTITLDDGTQLPAFSSANANGLKGIVLNQDNRNYSGICAELRPTSPLTKAVTDSVLTGVTIEFNTHDDDKNDDTQLSLHIVNRLSATSSQDISVATDVAKGQPFPDSGSTYKRLDLPLPSHPIFLRDIVLPVVFINILAGTDQWSFDYRVTFFFGQDQPYSWTVSGVVLDQDHHKHMGVYNGRPFPSLAHPQAALTPRQGDSQRHKAISLAFVGQKLEELFNERQRGDDPLVKVTLDSATSFGDQVPPSFLDTQWIENGPPAPDGASLDPAYDMPVAYSHSLSALPRLSTYFGIGVHLNEIRSQSLTLSVNSGDDQTPLTLDLQFETGGAKEITGTDTIDATEIGLRLRLTLRFDAATNSVDLMGWVDDLNGITFTPEPVTPSIYTVSGTFLGQPVSGVTATPDKFRSDLLDQVVHVVFTAAPSDPGGTIQKLLRQGIFDRLSEPDAITTVTPRESINAKVSSWLMGGVIASGNPELVPYENPCRLLGVSVHDDVLTLDYLAPEKDFAYQVPSGWSKAVLAPGALAHIDHIVVLTQENRSFDHMLGYLSLPYEKGGMNRPDVDGLKGDELNPLDGRKCASFRLAAGDTIFSPGPPNSSVRVAAAINGGKMDGFVHAQADECGPATAYRVMGYHTADNVPTYDSLARDFAIGHRWFAPHPGPTFPNRFYELTGRPNIDPWGAWEYDNSSPLLPVFTDTVFDHLSDRGISWRYFEHAYSFLRFFERHTFDSENLVSFDDPVHGFAALAKAGNLPSVSFIDPHYVDYPPDSFCDEPPSDIRRSQRFIRDLVNTVVSSPEMGCDPLDHYLRRARRVL